MRSHWTFPWSRWATRGLVIDELVINHSAWMAEADYMCHMYGIAGLAETMSEPS